MRQIPPPRERILVSSEVVVAVSVGFVVFLATVVVGSICGTVSLGVVSTSRANTYKIKQSKVNVIPK